jgi:RimJ/RimL family protein N-acetyltransferase
MSDAIGPRAIKLPGEPLIDGPTALRPWRDSDLEALVVACADPEIARWTSVPANYGESDARRYLAQRHDMAHAGAAAPFAIVAAPDGELLGSISLMRIAWEHQRAQLGYWLAAPARGHGHATRAVRMLCAWGIARLGLERISLLAATANKPSQAVARRSGFTHEAVLRSYATYGGRRVDMASFSLLASAHSPR